MRRAAHLHSNMGVAGAGEKGHVSRIGPGRRGAPVEIPAIGAAAHAVTPGCRHTFTRDAPLAIHIVLVHPEIHWNTGNAGRTCLAAGATLHLIEPLGFSLDEREVKRAGLDYWENVDVRVWPSWDAFERELPALGEPFFFSTKSSRLLWDAPLGAPNDVVLIFGRETGGLPAELHERYRDRFVTMPILSPRVRSLNLSTSVAIAAYEVLRQRRENGKR